MSKSPVDVDSVADDVEKRFHAGRRVLSFGEYLALFEEDPIRFSRDASGVRDAVLWGESISVYLQRWPPAWPDRPPASSSG